MQVFSVKQPQQLSTLQQLEEMTAFANSSAEVRDLAEISAKTNFHSVAQTQSKSWVRAIVLRIFLGFLVISVDIR